MHNSKCSQAAALCIQAEAMYKEDNTVEPRLSGPTLATGVRIRVRIIEIVRITKINTVLFEHMRKLIIFILYNYIHGTLIIFTTYRNSI